MKKLIIIVLSIFLIGCQPLVHLENIEFREEYSSYPEKWLLHTYWWDLDGSTLVFPSNYDAVLTRNDGVQFWFNVEVLSSNRLLLVNKSTNQPTSVLTIIYAQEINNTIRLWTEMTAILEGKTYQFGLYQGNSEGIFYPFVINNYFFEDAKESPRLIPIPVNRFFVEPNI